MQMELPEIRRYESSDYGDVMKWLSARGIKHIHPNVLPKVGFIIPNVAAVWLYQTDSDFCYLENLYSNPNEEFKRDQIDMLVQAAIDEAKRLGFKFVQSVTTHPSILRRGILLGAKTETGQTLMTLQLK